MRTLTSQIRVSVAVSRDDRHFLEEGPADHRGILFTVTAFSCRAGQAGTPSAHGLRATSANHSFLPSLTPPAHRVSSLVLARVFVATAVLLGGGRFPEALREQSWW